MSKVGASFREQNKEEKLQLSWQNGGESGRPRGREEERALSAFCEVIWIKERWDIKLLLVQKSTIE